MKLTKKWTSLVAAAAVALPVFGAGAKLVCTETGKALTKCCCKEEAGKLVCQETGKTLGKCCCVAK